MGIYVYCTPIHISDGLHGSMKEVRMPRFAGFIVFLGVALIVIGFLGGPGSASSQDERLMLLAIVIGFALLLIGVLLGKVPWKSRRGGLDLSKDAPAPPPLVASRTGVPEGSISPGTSKRYIIPAGYSYGRDMLTAHIHRLSSEQKTMDILRNIVAIMDEYAGVGGLVTIGGHNVLELARFAAEKKLESFSALKREENEIRFMRPLLAGLKAYILIGDCGAMREEIPDSIGAVLAIDGPPEADEVIRYVLEQFQS